MIQKALFGAGCFWGVEEHFRTINGVIKTVVGYSGGKTKNPTYESVCYENTDHVEVLLVEFDEDLISYERLVEEFWKCHDPTTLDRQGPDVGRQYRSVIYYYNDMQKDIANKSKERHQDSFQNNIVTEISHADIFYKAEEYHQKYIQKGNSCAV
ncbi:peptide-methionine (S)-S-oxide reductase MsrA [Alphaproteobacteria bacterium]|nr:peptide-methionine (S)-S-oxide reductase MsrA [Alphaproteobacteria bacterium]